MNKFAERLKELRIENNLTQDKLAEKTQIAQASISKYELGLQSPTLEAIITLCKFFNVTSDYLIGMVD